MLKTKYRRSSLIGMSLTSLVIFMLWSFVLWIAPSFFWIDDFQSEFLPVVLEIARAIREGSWPLLTSHSWISSNLAGEYRYGVFSAFEIISNSILGSLSIPLVQIAALLILIHQLILGSGAYLLARSYRAPFAYAIICAVVTVYNGWLINWASRSWCAALISFTWVPWLWWSLKLALKRSEPKWIISSGIFLYLILSAGWPHTVIMAGIVCLILTVGQTVSSRNIPIASMTLVCLIGIGLSAPALISIYEYSEETLRSQPALWQKIMGVSAEECRLPIEALLGLIWPTFKIKWHMFGGSIWSRYSIDLFGGWLPILGLFTTLFFKHKFLNIPSVVICIFSLVLCMLNSIGPLRDNFRFLPLFFLALSLAGISGWIFIFQKLHCFRWIKVFSFLLVISQLGISALTLIQSRDHFSLASYDINLPYRKIEPLNLEHTYLAVMSSAAYNKNNRFVGNMPMYSGLSFINGYSPMLPRSYFNWLHQDHVSQISKKSAIELLNTNSEEHSFLKVIGIDGLLVDQEFRESIPTLIKEGWIQVGKEDNWTFLELKKPSPIISLYESDAPLNEANRFTKASFNIIYNDRLSSKVEVSVPLNGPDAILVFKRPWQSAYRAWIDGSPVNVESIRSIVPAIRVAPGEHRIVLEYRPTAIMVGLPILVAALILIIFIPKIIESLQR